MNCDIYSDETGTPFGREFGKV